VQEQGESSLHEQEVAAKAEQLAQVKTNPLVASMMQAFPGAEVVGVEG
jgi:hypothetical protein